MWVGGPPNPMQPIRPHSRAMVVRRTGSALVSTPTAFPAKSGRLAGAWVLWPPLPPARVTTRPMWGARALVVGSWRVGLGAAESSGGRPVVGRPDARPGARGAGPNFGGRADIAAALH